MPNRIIKESINESRDLTSCTFFAQDLYKRLITYADDYGRFNADPQIMIARLYPRELAVVSLDDLIDALVELTGTGKIGFYTSKTRKEVYGAFPKWGDHQRIRDSKKKSPEPEDTTVNDWYLRRFIPNDMKTQIVERDKFKCKICGKHIAEVEDAKRLVKMGTGMFHIDHIVPCSQGGRATMENLRLTCSKCNLSRKRAFSYDEILNFSAETVTTPQVAAGCGEVRPNPIHSESESESNPNPKTRGKRERFAPPTVQECEAFFTENGATVVQATRFHCYYAANGWKTGKNPMKDWQAAARGWILRDKESGFSAGNRASPQQTQDKMMRYTPEERRKTYQAAELNFDEEE